MNLETKIIIYKFTPQVFTLTLGKSHKFNDLWDFFLFHYLCPIGYYLALYRIRIYTLVLTELQYICAILEQII